MVETKRKPFKMINCITCLLTYLLCSAQDTANGKSIGGAYVYMSTSSELEQVLAESSLFVEQLLFNSTYIFSLANKEEKTIKVDINYEIFKPVAATDSKVAVQYTFNFASMTLDNLRKKYYETIK